MRMCICEYVFACVKCAGDIMRWVTMEHARGRGGNDDENLEYGDDSPRLARNACQAELCACCALVCFRFPAGMHVAVP